jgi:hypothetical protein
MELVVELVGPLGDAARQALLDQWTMGPLGDAAREALLDQWTMGQASHSSYFDGQVGARSVLS